MNPNEITTEAVMALDPCPEYPVERVEALVRRLATETPFDVLASIPFDDAHWFLAQALPVPEQVQWVEACARRAQEYAEEADDTEAAADAAYWADDWVYWASMAANYAGGIAAQRAEQQLAIRHGVQLLGAL